MPLFGIGGLGGVPEFQVLIADRRIEGGPQVARQRGGLNELDDVGEVFEPVGSAHSRSELELDQLGKGEQGYPSPADGDLGWIRK